MVIMLYRKEYAEIGLTDLKMVILIFKIENEVVHQKSFETKNWKHYLMKIHVRLNPTLQNY